MGLMLSGPGFSREKPNHKDPKYLDAAFEQTRLDKVRDDAELLEGVRKKLQKSGVRFHGFQLGSFLESTVLTYLGVERDKLLGEIPHKEPDPAATRLLLFAQNSDGHFYPSIGDIVGAAGHPVAVVSPDELLRQRQNAANPNITYRRKSMGALTLDQSVLPGFDVALISGDNDPIGHPDSGPDEHGIWTSYSSADRIRGVLRVMRGAGRVVVSDPQEVKGFLDTITSDSGLATEIHQSYDAALLHSYDDNGTHAYATPPYLVLEKRA